jgi:hypothetical protein
MNMNLILSAPRVSGITIIKYAQNENIKNPNNLNVFGRKKSKGFKQDSQNKIILSCSTEKHNVVGWGVIMLLGICE